MVPSSEADLSMCAPPPVMLLYLIRRESDRWSAKFQDATFFLKQLGLASSQTISSHSYYYTLGFNCTNKNDALTIINCGFPDMS